MKQVYIMTLYIGLAMLFMPQAMAGGFAVNGVSASAMGVADAVVAAADDVSAASYNPAGLAWQDGIQGMAGLKVQYRNSSSEITAGTASNRGSTGNLGHLYASWMPHDSNLGVSLAYSRPFAVDNDWSSGLPAAGQTRIKADRLSVDAIYSIGSSLAIAAGADWYISSASLSQPGNVFNGNDKTAFGGHLSVKWKPAPMWSLGAMARMGAKLNLSGNANQTLDIQLPDELTVGVAYDLIDAVRLELDTTWSRWSKLTDLNVLSGTTLVQSNALDMQDTFTIMVGATWFWLENTQMRVGYAYDQGANSSSAFNPMLADQDGHRISLGLGGEMFGVHADIAANYTIYPNSTVSGLYAGTYRDQQFGIALSVSKGF